MIEALLEEIGGDKEEIKRLKLQNRALANERKTIRTHNKNIHTYNLINPNSSTVTSRISPEKALKNRS